MVPSVRFLFMCGVTLPSTGEVCVLLLHGVRLETPTPRCCLLPSQSISLTIQCVCVCLLVCVEIKNIQMCVCMTVWETEVERVCGSVQGLCACAC